MTAEAKKADYSNDQNWINSKKSIKGSANDRSKQTGHSVYQSNGSVGLNQVFFRYQGWNTGSHRRLIGALYGIKKNQGDKYQKGKIQTTKQERQQKGDQRSRKVQEHHNITFVETVCHNTTDWT